MPKVKPERVFKWESFADKGQAAVNLTIRYDYRLQTDREFVASELRKIADTIQNPIKAK